MIQVWNIAHRPIQSNKDQGTFVPLKFVHATFIHGKNLNKVSLRFTLKIKVGLKFWVVNILSLKKMLVKKNWGYHKIFHLGVQNILDRGLKKF